MSQPQQQPEKVSDEPLSVNEVVALHQLLNIGYNKAAYGIEDAMVVWTLNRRMRAILEKAAAEAQQKPTVGGAPLKAKTKKSAKAVIEDVASDDDDAEAPHPVHLK